MTSNAVFFCIVFQEKYNNAIMGYGSVQSRTKDCIILMTIKDISVQNSHYCNAVFIVLYSSKNTIMP